MKKLISIVLALCFALVLASCGKSDTSKTNSGKQAGSFVKPEHYASVLLVTINPQFRLYLDENEKVLAVEAVNKDAESIKNNIAFENQSFETVIETIVTEANKNGFVKEDATINFEIVESKENSEAKSDILAKAQKNAADTANELKIEIKVNVGEIKTGNDTSSSNTEPNNNPSSSKPTNTQNPTTPSHTHSFSAATCTEPKKCSCGAVEGTALGHNYKDGICTRCNAKDPNFKPLTSVLTKQGRWTLKYLNKNELYSVSITVCTPGKNSAGAGIGDPLSTLPDEMQNDPDIKSFCEVFNGVTYYVGRGTGDDIKSVTEENNTVTLTDSLGNKLVLARTGENTLKCTSVSKSFADIDGIPVGSVFTFVAN